MAETLLSEQAQWAALKTIGFVDGWFKNSDTIEHIALMNQATILRCLSALLVECEQRRADSKQTDELIERLRRFFPPREQADA